MILSKSQHQALIRKGSECFRQLKSEMEINKDRWINEFVLCMQDYCKKIIKMQQAGLKDAIGYLNLSLLRTKLLSGENHIRLDAYNDRWYLDRIECAGTYEVSHFYGRLREVIVLLEKLRRETFNSLTLGEIHELFFHESYRYFVTVSEFLREAIKKVVKTEEYQAVKRASLFHIYFGEYQGALTIIYKEDNEPKESKVVKRYLESKQEVYTYEFCDNLDLSGGNFENIMITHSSFAKCNFDMSNWQGSKMLLCEFKSALFRHTDFNYTELTKLDFSDATLEFVSFRGAKIKNTIFRNATLIGIDFSEVLILEDVDFENVTLIGSALPNPSTKEVLP